MEKFNGLHCQFSTEAGMLEDISGSHCHTAFCLSVSKN